MWYRNGRHAQGSTPPAQRAGALCPAPAALDHYGWQQYWQACSSSRSPPDYDFAADRFCNWKRPLYWRDRPQADRGDQLDFSQAPSALKTSSSARAVRVHRLCAVNAFIVRSRTSCVAFGLGSPYRAKRVKWRRISSAAPDGESALLQHCFSRPFRSVATAARGRLRSSSPCSFGWERPQSAAVAATWSSRWVACVIR